MECQEISDYAANKEAGVNPDHDVNILFPAILIGCGTAVPAIVMYFIEGTSLWWAIGIISLTGTFSTGLLLAVYPVGYWKCMSLRRRFNRLLARAAHMQAMQKAGMAAWECKDFEDVFFQCSEIRKDVLSTLKTVRDFSENRKIARKGGLSRKPWKMASLAAKADIPRIEARMGSVEARIAKMMAETRSSNT
jgi:hypothetical protein